MPSAILIGGTGFIGSHLATFLAEEAGYDVTCVDRGPGHLPLPAGVQVVQADVRQPLDPAPYPRNPDLVVNLAAVHREPGHEPEEYYEANVGGAVNVVRLCEDLGAQNVVFVSSISVYGPTEAPISEADAPAPTTHYGRSKLMAEEVHRAWRAQDPDHRKLTVVRPAVVYGRGEGGNFTRLGSALLRKRFVYPGRKDTIKANGYVTDLVRSIEFMQRQPEREITYNYAAQETWTLEQIIEAFSRVAGLQPPKLKIPKGPMLLVGTIGDKTGFVGRSVGLSKRRIEKLITSTNIRADVLGRSGFEYRFNLEQALADWYGQEPVGKFE